MPFPPHRLKMLALLMLTCSTPAIVQAQRGESDDDRIRNAIDNNQASPEVTALAEAKLNTVISRFRTLGGDIAATHLESFLQGNGTDFDYTINDPEGQAFATFDGAEFSHKAAHEFAMRRIKAYFEQEIKAGRRNFPAEFPLSDLGFTQTGPDRLQGPNVYEAGAVFGVPLFPAVALNMSAGFGDMQGPHEGKIRNVTLTETENPDGTITIAYEFDIDYKWTDHYTFDNDANMSEFDAAAHYLEFVAKAAKEFHTSVSLTEHASESVVITEQEAENVATNPHNNTGNSGSNSGGSSNNGSNGSHGAGGNNGSTGGSNGSSAGNGGSNSGNNGSSGGNSGSTGGGTGGGNNGGNSSSGGSKTKLPPINIPHPPGWGVGK